MIAHVMEFINDGDVKQRKEVKIAVNASLNFFLVLVANIKCEAICTMKAVLGFDVDELVPAAVLCGHSLSSFQCP